MLIYPCLRSRRFPLPTLPLVTRTRIRDTPYFCVLYTPCILSLSLTAYPLTDFGLRQLLKTPEGAFQLSNIKSLTQNTALAWRGTCE